MRVQCRAMRGECLGVSVNGRTTPGTASACIPIKAGPHTCGKSSHASLPLPLLPPASAVRLSGQGRSSAAPGAPAAGAGHRPGSRRAKSAAHSRVITSVGPMPRCQATAPHKEVTEVTLSRMRKTKPVQKRLVGMGP